MLAVACLEIVKAAASKWPSLVPLTVPSRYGMRKALPGCPPIVERVEMDVNIRVGAREEAKVALCRRHDPAVLVSLQLELHLARLSSSGAPVTQMSMRQILPGYE